MKLWDTFWSYATNTEPNERGFPKPTRPAPQMPPVRNPPPPEKGISEPVLSIIQTLKDGEWSCRSFIEYSSVVVVFKHEWFGNELQVYCFTRYGDKDIIECQSEWMTQAEKEAVGDVCWQIYQGRVKWEKEQSLAKQRESYMVLIKPCCV